MAKAVRAVRCPTCGKDVEWKPENRFRPFCSERCKQIDLGAWASEAYRVPSAPPDAELPDAPAPAEPPARRR
ncbi:DNA gyrase inhibitor YacG [Thauera sinica]|uniref:DNA gyrase inhibitor YacG n=1 Tax=Thauera sinica TaxID=2665146 RepID=A0ABW1ATR5_9RHOO|nr:DNA gyrase inhibitor YacG [Thauera sp. K11]ATE58566.1 DNA gyrase inhibitor YacG [Thauera sp. K11]